MSAKPKKAAKDGTPYPPDFNRWSNLARCHWLEEHALPVESVKELPQELEVNPAVRSVTPTAPPQTATPVPPEPGRPASAPMDFTLEMAKILAEEIHKLQRYYNAKAQPPADWETLWVAESAELVKLTEGKDPYLRWPMLKDVTVVSQVKYAKKYTSPASIAEHIPELAEEVLALRISNELDAVKVMHQKALGRPMNDDDNETDVEALERRAKDERKCAEISLNNWKRWMASHRQSNQPQSTVA